MSHDFRPVTGASTLESTVRMMNRQAAAEPINEVYRAPDLADVAARVLRETNTKTQRNTRILTEEGGEEKDANFWPQLTHACQMYRDLLGDVKPTDRDLVLSLDGYSGIERPAFVAKITRFVAECTKLSEAIKCTQADVLQMISAATFINEHEEDGGDDPSAYEVAMFTFYLSKLLGVSLEKAHELLCQMVLKDED